MGQRRLSFIRKASGPRTAMQFTRDLLRKSGSKETVSSSQLEKRWHHGLQSYQPKKSDDIPHRMEFTRSSSVVPRPTQLISVYQSRRAIAQFAVLLCLQILSAKAQGLANNSATEVYPPVRIGDKVEVKHLTRGWILGARFRAHFHHYQWNPDRRYAEIPTARRQSKSGTQVTAETPHSTHIACFLYTRSLKPSVSLSIAPVPTFALHKPRQQSGSRPPQGVATATIWPDRIPREH